MAEPPKLIAFQPKKIQTRVKHFLLEKYLDAWGGIIINTNQTIRLGFVDTCCGSGLYYASERDEGEREPEYEMGSAVIGPVKLMELVGRGLQRGRSISAKALLINKDGAELAAAMRAIPSGVRDSVELDPKPGRFVDLVEHVLGFCDNTFSFVLIDPYGPTPTPFSSVAAVVRGRYTDTLINFPFLTLQRWSGFVDKRRLSQDERKKLTAADSFMGGGEWQDAVRECRRTGLPLEDALTRLYIRSLRKTGVFAIALPLRFAGRRRIIYHLVFTTHNVAGLAAAKEKFLESADEQIRLREQAEFENIGQSSFEFSIRQAPSVDVARLADALYGTFHGTNASVEEIILRGLSEPLAVQADVNKALTQLRRAGKAQYSDKRYNDIVKFK